MLVRPKRRRYDEVGRPLSPDLSEPLLLHIDIVMFASSFLLCYSRAGRTAASFSTRLHRHLPSLLRHKVGVMELRP